MEIELKNDYIKYIENTIFLGFSRNSNYMSIFYHLRDQIGITTAESLLQTWNTSKDLLKVEILNSSANLIHKNILFKHLENQKKKKNMF